MSPMAVRKNLSSAPHSPIASRPSRFAERRVRPAPQSAEERIPPATVQYNEPAAGDVLQADTALSPVIKTVSVKEAAFRLRKSPDSIYSWLRRGRLRGWQPGGPGCQILVIESSVEQALRNMLGSAAPLQKTI